MILPFTKMDGAGNDFVVIDNRELKYNLTKEKISAICGRRRGIGADGFIAVEPADKNADFKFRFFNSDGSEAEMCGNGARCFALFASKLTDPPKNSLTFETIVGTLRADILGNDEVRIGMSSPENINLDIHLDIDGLRDTPIHLINTGVPHAVIFVEDIDAIDVIKLGSTIRHHEYFAPNGTNVNFAQVVDSQHLLARTYERGVEDETLACGTGVTACALIHHLITNSPSPIKVTSKGGEILTVDFNDYESDSLSGITLTGPAKTTFTGTLLPKNQ